MLVLAARAALDRTAFLKYIYAAPQIVSTIATFCYLIYVYFLCIRTVANKPGWHAI